MMMVKRHQMQSITVKKHEDISTVGSTSKLYATNNIFLIIRRKI